MLEYNVRDDVATIALDRPDKMNALTVELGEELVAALSRAEQESRVVVLTGNGNAFCAGADLQDSPISAETSFDELRDRLSVFQSITGTIRDMSVPVISRINGPAMGAGCDIALAADFRIASENAVLCESFINVGVISGDGGSYILPRLAGEQVAKEMILLGREIHGPEAADLGLVNEVASNEELDSAVAEYVDPLLDLPPMALGRAKQLINNSLDDSRSTSFEEAIYAMWVCLQSEDFEEARQAFQEKRKPEFS